jgi:hypothetical protein
MKDWRDLKDIIVTLQAPTDEDTTRRVPLLGDIAYQLHPLLGIIQQCHNNVADISFNWKMLLASRKRLTKDKGLHHPKIVGLLPRKGEESLRSAILASHHPAIRGRWAELPRLLNTHAATSKRKYLRVIPDEGAINTPLLVLLGVLLVDEARITPLLVSIKVLLGAVTLPPEMVWSDDDDTQGPLSLEILNTPLPKGLEKPPNLGQYDGQGDPDDHIAHIDVELVYRRVKGPIRCRLFATTLKKGVLDWYKSLAPGSITSWSQLCTLR